MFHGPTRLSIPNWILIASVAYSHSSWLYFTMCVEVRLVHNLKHCPCTTTAAVLQPFFRDHPGESVPEENFWTLWCNGRLTEADTLTIRLGATPSGLTGAHLHHPPIFLWARCPSCRPANGVKALKATSAFGLGRRR